MQPYATYARFYDATQGTRDVSTFVEEAQIYILKTSAAGAASADVTARSSIFQIAFPQRRRFRLFSGMRRCTPSHCSARCSVEWLEFFADAVCTLTGLGLAPLVLFQTLSSGFRFESCGRPAISFQAYSWRGPCAAERSCRTEAEVALIPYRKS